jgi:hypothetical protein
MRTFAVLLLFVSSAGFAQQQQDELEFPKLRIVKEDCATRPSGEIVVCGTRDRTSPYRLPKLQDGFDPRGPVDSVARERARLMQGDESGIGSCSNRGPGGMTGCWLQAVKNKRLQHGK